MRVFVCRGAQAAARGLASGGPSLRVVSDADVAAMGRNAMQVRSGQTLDKPDPASEALCSAQFFKFGTELSIRHVAKSSADHIQRRRVPNSPN